MGDQYLRFRWLQYFHSQPHAHQNEYPIGYSDIYTDSDTGRHIYTDAHAHANVHFYAGSISNLHTDADRDEHVECIGSDLCGWVRIWEFLGLDIQ